MRSRRQARFFANCSVGSIVASGRTQPFTHNPSTKEFDMPNSVEMDRTVPLAAQLADEGGPVILINTFVVPPEDADKLVEAWTNDAAVMKRQPGFISTQLHRGIAG